MRLCHAAHLTFALLSFWVVDMFIVFYFILSLSLCLGLTTHGCHPPPLPPPPPPLSVHFKLISNGNEERMKVVNLNGPLLSECKYQVRMDHSWMNASLKCMDRSRRAEGSLKPSPSSSPDHDGRTIWSDKGLGSGLYQYVNVHMTTQPSHSGCACWQSWLALQWLPPDLEWVLIIIMINVHDPHQFCLHSRLQ